MAAPPVVVPPVADPPGGGARGGRDAGTRRPGAAGSRDSPGRRHAAVRRPVRPGWPSPGAGAGQLLPVPQGRHHREPVRAHPDRPGPARVPDPVRGHGGHRRVRRELRGKFRPAPGRARLRGDHRVGRPPGLVRRHRRGLGSLVRRDDRPGRRGVPATASACHRRGLRHHGHVRRHDRAGGQPGHARPVRVGRAHGGPRPLPADAPGSRRPLGADLAAAAGPAGRRPGRTH